MFVNGARKLLPFRPAMMAWKAYSTSSSQMVIYGFPLSQPTRSVLMLCQEAKIDYNFILVDALKGDTRKPDFRKINPAGLVPVINDNGENF